MALQIGADEIAQVLQVCLQILSFAQGAHQGAVAG